MKDGLKVPRRALIFMNSVDRAHTLHTIISPLMDNSVGLYTSNMPLKDREMMLSNFKEGALKGLVVTDILARGLDLPNTCVINYDCPFRAETYVHRAGRTARAGNAGEVYVLGLWTELSRWSSMRSELQGGNVAKGRTRADQEYLDAIRPSFLGELDKTRKKRRKNETLIELMEKEKARKQWAEPLSNSNFEEALKILQNNQ